MKFLCLTGNKQVEWWINERKSFGGGGPCD